MAIKKALFNIKGMTRDLAASKFDPQYAYENHNLRIVATDSNDSLSLVNEKGNIVPTINWSNTTHNEDNYVFGTPIGQEVLDDTLILFTAGDENTADLSDATETSVDDISAAEETIDIDSIFEDRIYKFTLDSENSQELVGTKLFRGDLNFSTDNPLETLGLYENENLKKVYWVDGLNQPRVINIEAEESIIENWTSKSFDFVPTLSLGETITIERNTIAGGYFAPGVIQYFFTYYTIHGQESNIFYSSPLYYTSYNNRGASADDTVSNSFNITITGSTYDTNFSCIRVYSILRTSIDGTPQARKVVDLDIPSDSSSDISYTDTGEAGETISPEILFYIGGKDIVVGTISAKDNTLFSGDIEVNNLDISSVLENYTFEDITFTTTNRENISVGSPTGLYPYTNQLKTSSSELKTFKYLEYYRFGIQAQYYTGEWSSPIWIADVQNDKYPSIDSSGDVYLPCAYTYIESNIINQLLRNGYVKVRPVVVFPKIGEREVICQGVLSPTVYNVGDRANNSPYSQASWFFRPNSYIDVEEEVSSYALPSGTTTANSWAAQVRNDVFTYNGTEVNNFNRGKWIEFRHNLPIPNNNEENAEIQCIMDAPTSPIIYPVASDSYRESWVALNQENFFIDQSIVTLNSPDIEFDTQIKDLDTSALKLRIIGTINITASASDISILSETPVNNYYNKTTDGEIEYYAQAPIGFYKEGISTSNLSKFGWRSIVSGGFWLDDISAPLSSITVNASGETQGFVVYPWHRSLSYNNATSENSSGYISAKVGQKKLSILRYSFNNTYINDIDHLWNAYEEDDANHPGVSDIVIFDSEEETLIKLSAQYPGSDTINYFGNINKVLTFPNAGTTKTEGYPIVTTGRLNTSGSTTWNVHDLLAGNYYLPDETFVTGVSLSTYTDQIKAVDPVSIKYKSSPHAVIALNYALINGKILQNILPTNQYDNNGETDQANYLTSIYTSGWHPFWDKQAMLSGVYQDAIDLSYLAPEYGYLWLGELYNDAVTSDTRFGGTTETALKNNEWVPAGEAVSLGVYDTSGEAYIRLWWLEGDTYYQRYDCLKTYPYTTEDQNSIVDILSFMVETRVNIDGRYDRNRGQINNLNVTPSNFNLLNSVYSQKNNFFTYRYLRDEDLETSKFPNVITWSKAKTTGEEIDTWTNVTLASTIELDGTKGPLRAIKNFNNTLLTFQDNGVSQILYNENVQIASTTGVPIEIANSGKVSGKRYISNHIGCTNKWSICSTPNGLYFLDSLRKDFYLFNGQQFTNISDNLGFHSWVVNEVSNNNIWNPVDYGSFRTLYDRVNEDVLITTEDTALAFSEPLQHFSSFYDYGDTPYFGNLEDTGIAWHKNSDGYYAPWLHRQGEYNSFFGEYKPFWTTVIVNPDPTEDKIFNNLEYRADGFSGDTHIPEYSFNYLRTWNEYQEGESTLEFNQDIPANLKKKFRVWRANIPRWNIDKNGQTANKRDRMRNPWLYLQLKMQGDNVTTNYKTVLHDLVVDYFE